MTLVRDSDIRRILKELASGNSLSVTIHSPFIDEGLKGYRHFDKEYSLDGLTVFLEAVLGKKHEGEKDDWSKDVRLVTLEEHETYQQAYAGADRKIAKGRKDTKRRERAYRNFAKVWNYMEAPLVTSADDRELTSIWIKSVHVQYEGTDIGQLRTAFLNWGDDIASIARHYGVKAGAPSYGFLEESPVQSADSIPPKPEYVFFRRISGDDIAAVEGGIRAVYIAGAGIRDILQSEVGKEQPVLKTSQKA